MTVKFTKKTKKLLFVLLSPHNLKKMNQRNDPEPSRKVEKKTDNGSTQNTKAELESLRNGKKKVSKKLLISAKIKHAKEIFLQNLLR